MQTLDELQKNRELISALLKKETDGEIVDFDFIIDYVTNFKPVLTILLSVPAETKRKYDFSSDRILDNNFEKIKRVISASGFPKIFSKQINFQIL